MDDASKIVHLGERCSRYSRRVYRNEKQAGRSGRWGLSCGGAELGGGRIAEGERDSARIVLCGKWGREESGAHGKVSPVPAEQIAEGTCCRAAKNDEPCAIPIVPALRMPLRAQFARRQPDSPHVCFRVDRGERSDKIKSFRKPW